MPESTESLLQRFKAKKAEKDSTSLQEARRLVNLYRSLSCFGDDFVGKYNEMLLMIKPNVRRLLGTFMGGKEVEDYLEFLEQNAHLSVSEKGQTDTDAAVVPQNNKGYLPDPDLDIGAKKTTEDVISVRTSEWKELQNKKEALEKQMEDLVRTLRKTEGNSAASEKEGISSVGKTSSFENYSEILEESAGGKANE